jgi:pimeloyl-ACP methyl ester carboxylesterase
MVGFLDIDGLSVAYRESGEGPPLLLLHGWPTSSHLWRDVTPALAQSHRVIAPDLPGFGASSKPLGVQYSFELFGGVLDALVDRLELDGAGLVAHDTGGPIAMHWALQRPERVSRIALLNTLLYPDFHESVGEFVGTLSDPERRERLVSPEGIRNVLRFGVSEPERLGEDVLAGYADPFEEPEAREALAAAGIGLSPDGFAEIARGLPSLSVPLLCVYGAKDRVLPDVAETFARVKHDVPHAEVHELPDAGHFIQEEQPDDVAAHLARFFA